MWSRRDMGAMSSRYQLGILGLSLIGLVLLACSPDVDSAPTPTPDTEAAYIDALTQSTDAANRSLGRATELMGPIFPRFAPDEIQARVLFNGLKEVDFSEMIAEMLSALEPLTPPVRVVEDHGAYLDRLREQVTTAGEIDDAIQKGDLPRVHLKIAELAANFDGIRAAVSPEFCRYISPDVTPDAPALGGLQDPEAFCGDDPIPGGGYGLAVNRLAKMFIAQFGPRANFPPGMTPKELLEGLTYVQPAIVDLFETTLAELDPIEPPPEYSEGHRILYDYFDELLSTARAIDAAVADGDYDQVIREFERSGQIARTADDRLPDNYRPLVKIIFGETSGPD